MSKVFVRTPLNYDAAKVSHDTALRCTDRGKTQQHQVEEADINTIVRRFGLTGQLPAGANRVPPSYGDFSNVGDYHEAMNVVRAAQEAFMALPSATRERFGHDPQNFVEFCSNPKNGNELVKMGLAKARPVEKQKTGSEDGSQPAAKPAGTTNSPSHT